MYLIIISCVCVGFLSSVESAGDPPPDDPCDREVYTGPCNTSFPAYAFNKMSNQCEEINGACQNFPIFISEETCEIVCEDVCYKKIAPGNCTGYAYNKTSVQCETFSNGACDENGNYYKTEEECEEECENRCNKRIAKGDCNAFVPSFGYNKTTGQCIYFIYGECGGTANRFPSEEECEETCEDDPCKMLIEPGNCRGSIPRYGYNKTTGQCVPFTYGGCGANANNFKTEKDCENQCEDVCNKSIESGPCYALIPRYGFNNATGQCEEFTYGGCGGNGNNFEIEKDCEDKCEAGCDKPIDSGPICKLPITRWAYNETTRQCQTFSYNGCLGNGNNYETEKDCEEECEN